ncbi:MAG TPA: hypothetical protein DET40_17565 [Lentisphaeria bacterium]|nr:MAG: hypothetical protein A2X45_02440 [Lentisphaerae bacterium GWF2_50_93]HCE45351.1 hypothetical protein [Lentisphaeria bacterium]
MKISTKFRKIKDDFNIEPTRLSKRLNEMEPAAVLRQLPITWARAEDFTVYDDKGNQWIDMTSGIFVANAGHSNPSIKKAIQDQLDKDLLFAYNYPTDIRNKFLNKMLDISPKSFDKVILLNSGSEAVDIAYKLIKQWSRKNNRKYIITFTGSYHGRGLSNDLICGRKNKAAWSGVEDKDVVFIDFPYDESTSFPEDKMPPSDEIAAFVLETFQGWGAWFYPPGYLESLVKFARRSGALVCFDDLQGGFYRLGTLYGYQSYGLDFDPDILCLGKGLSSSLPISAVLSRADITEIDTYADLHGTHSGNPLCCAAALANLEFLSDMEFQAEFKKRCRIFKDGIKNLSRHKSIRSINVRGMIAGIITSDEEAATSIVFNAIKRGVLTVWTQRNSVKIAPPLTITEDAIAEAIAVLDESVSESEKFSRK